MAKITTKQLALYAADQLLAGHDAKVISQQVASVLVKERRSRDLLRFSRALEAELHSRGTTQVTLTSAHRLDDAVKQQLASMLSATNPHFNEVIDTSVIGGVRAETLHAQVDLTVQGQLMRFKRNVTEEQ